MYHRNRCRRRLFTHMLESPWTTDQPSSYNRSHQSSSLPFSSFSLSSYSSFPSPSSFSFPLFPENLTVGLKIREDCNFFSCEKKDSKSFYRELEKYIELRGSTKNERKAS